MKFLKYPYHPLISSKSLPSGQSTLGPSDLSDLPPLIVKSSSPTSTRENNIDLGFHIGVEAVIKDSTGFVMVSVSKNSYGNPKFAEAEASWMFYMKGASSVSNVCSAILRSINGVLAVVCSVLVYEKLFMFDALSLTLVTYIVGAKEAHAVSPHFAQIQISEEDLDVGIFCGHYSSSGSCSTN
ncbi:hypothetical protein TIFTF001_005294 [Ficus carica]|uniref:Uncharacterized protein n=1 Tax=Ficus carica TaxID=3494 RepID=A0AA88CUJ0_FICCA|nr:hypothetical protein TIFTF001_005294 [Ficus carica]